MWAGVPGCEPLQLEDSELTSAQLPDLDRRGRVLYTESAEGGAGVLRRLVDEPDALARAARTALSLAHFDPETGEDLGDAGPSGERCERACYDCLLTYANQLDHLLIDRHAARALLFDLSHGRTVRGGGGLRRDEQVNELMARSDSSLERQLLEWLAERDYRLPDDAQLLVEEAGARPDLVYRLPSGPVAVFVDGPYHDAASAKARDRAVEENLRDLGWSVIRFRHDEDWAAVVGRYPSVFGAGRGVSQ